MVFHYTIRGGPCLGAHSHISLTPSDITCYVGEDKHENEYLIKYGWPGDVWFHVDSLSSAHVYFRVCTEAAPLKGIPIDNLPIDAVYDMMQIVKHNSIAGSKLASTKIVYTPHHNLKKTFQMESGTVTFHDTKLCRYGRCDKDRPRIKELEKTKIERKNVDFFEEMKVNERRLIERKKREKQASRRDDEEEFGLYDPIQDDLRAGRIKSTRQGDVESGLDNALAALDSVTFAPARTTIKMKMDDDEETEEDVPDWVSEEKKRSLEISPHVRFLCERGYTLLDATAAMARSNGSRGVALKSLWQGKNSMSVAHVDEEAIEARLEEKEVLRAIFGEDEGVVFNNDETLFDATIPISNYEPPARYETPPLLLLEIYVDDDMAPHYPASEPPVMALVGGGLPEALLAKLTNRLREEALERIQEEPGDPQIFNLLAFIAEQVELLIEQETVALEAVRKKRLQDEKEADELQRLADGEKRKVDSHSSTLFKNEQERRAYAKDIISNVAISKDDEDKRKEGAGKKYNTGISDVSLIKDLFG